LQENSQFVIFVVEKFDLFWPQNQQFLRAKGNGYQTLTPFLIPSWAKEKIRLLAEKEVSS